MSTDFAEIHDELRDVASGILGGPAPATWDQLADAGWLGLEVPEALGGAGATFAEVAVILEEMGRFASPGPYVSTAVLGVGTLALVAPRPARDALLGRIATGETRVAVAAWEGSDGCVGGRPAFRLHRSAESLRLEGRADFVLDVSDVDELLFLAVDPDEVPVVVHVEAGASGVSVEPQVLLDSTRVVGALRAEGASVGSESVWRLADDGTTGIRSVFDRGAVAIACDALGLAKAMLDATVAYAGVRHQFDRPIGSFQAVKHACADMLVKVSVSEQLVALAVTALVDDAPDASAATSRAASYVTAAAVDVVGSAMQLHGGIGYTWESGIHVHLKRAILDRALFGSPMAHRRYLADRIISLAAPAREG
ncbi:MAG TPA: acyl-CoA dehydrogenase family protein [Microthrixaceae bacterium]|nr:acyl-CoA dehydrogenase family protein [Microthrixaceae bacterium]